MVVVVVELAVVIIYSKENVVSTGVSNRYGKESRYYKILA